MSKISKKNLRDKNIQNPFNKNENLKIWFEEDKEYKNFKQKTKLSLGLVPESLYQKIFTKWQNFKNYYFARPKLLLPLAIGCLVLLIITPVWFSSYGNRYNISDFSKNESKSLGLSVDGAKDVNNFRQNIENGYTPQITDITTEGLFYDYEFQTDYGQKCQDLFCPGFQAVSSQNPLTKEAEDYLAVGLQSNISAKDFARANLNLSIVLDISGSMDSPFDEYYYDTENNNESIWNYEEGEKIKEKNETPKTKMQVVTEVISEMTRNLKNHDRLSFIVFDDQANTAMEFETVGEVDMDFIRNKIKEIKSQGGTNMGAGIDMAEKVYDDFLENNQADENYQNRILFFTDMMPNQGELSDSGLYGKIKKLSEQQNPVYTTFIGVGIDHNSELAEKISKVSGGNYLTINSEKDFQKEIDENFDYLVTPLVFDLEMSFESKDLEIADTYGVPVSFEDLKNNSKSLNIININTLFASKTFEEGSRGGVILLKLKNISGKENPEFKLKTNYKDKNQKNFSQEVVENLETFNLDIDWAKSTITSDTNKVLRDIQKGVLLSRYAELMQDWIIENRMENENNGKIEEDLNKEEFRKKIVSDLEFKNQLSNWEQSSIGLKISDQKSQEFQTFKEYLNQQIKEIGDSNLSQEQKLIETILQG